MARKLFYVCFPKNTESTNTSSCAHNSLASFVDSVIKYDYDD